MEKTQKFLSMASVIFKVLAWVSLVLGIISAIVIFVGGGTPDAPRITGFVGLLLGVVYLFLALTASEVITLLLDIAKKVDKGSTV